MSKIDFFPHQILIASTQSLHVCDENKQKTKRSDKLLIWLLYLFTSTRCVYSFILISPVMIGERTNEQTKKINKNRVNLNGKRRSRDATVAWTEWKCETKLQIVCEEDLCERARARPMLSHECDSFSRFFFCAKLCRYISIVVLANSHSHRRNNKKP